MSGTKLPREMRKKINTLAFRNTRDCMPRDKAYQQQKLILMENFVRLLSEGVAVDEALELLKDDKYKYTDQYSEAMKKLQSWK